MAICSSSNVFYFLYRSSCIFNRAKVFSSDWIFILSNTLSYYSLWYFKSQLRESICWFNYCSKSWALLIASLSFLSNSDIFSQLFEYFSLNSYIYAANSVAVLLFIDLSWWNMMTASSCEHSEDVVTLVFWQFYAIFNCFRVFLRYDISESLIRIASFSRAISYKRSSC